MVYQNSSLILSTLGVLSAAGKTPFTHKYFVTSIISLKASYEQMVS